MHNEFAIEVEAEARRREWERAAAADARAALAVPANRNMSWLSRAIGSLARLPALALPGTPVGAPLELRRVPRPVEC